MKNAKQKCAMPNKTQKNGSWEMEIKTKIEMKMKLKLKTKILKMEPRNINEKWRSKPNRKIMIRN